MHETRLHERNCFVTLTYDTPELPFVLDGDELLATLLPRDLQLFWKRLRKNVGPARYFACGEYGKATPENDFIARPHFHACVFGQDFSDDRTATEPTRSGAPQWQSDTLDAVWGKGRARVSELNFEGAAYVARYTTKKLTGEQLEEFGPRAPEFGTQSRRPGIGKGWFDRYSSDVFPFDEVIVRGRPTKPPRYYDKLLADRDPDQHQDVKTNREAARADRPELTRRQLSVREFVTKHRLRKKGPRR